MNKLKKFTIFLIIEAAAEPAHRPVIKFSNIHGQSIKYRQRLSAELVHLTAMLLPLSSGAKILSQNVLCPATNSEEFKSAPALQAFIERLAIFSVLHADCGRRGMNGGSHVTENERVVTRT